MLVLAVKTVVDADGINSIVFVIMSFLGLLHAVKVADGGLFDIPPEQNDAPLQFTRAKGLHIKNLSDMAVLKMTRFNRCQLCCLWSL